MSKLKKVTLHAARSKAFPQGSIRHGYVFFAPLTDDGKIDADAWKSHRGECFVRRFWADDPDMRGLLVHRPGGRGGANWAFELGAKLDDQEEGFRFADHVFRSGEYVSLREQGGELMTFRVASVV
jgi:hypothetical protein